MNMTELHSTIKNYYPFHDDFNNVEYFPQTNLLTFNQMIDVLDNPAVTLAADVLTGQRYLATFGDGSPEPIRMIDLEDGVDEELEALVAESIVKHFNIDGKPFGSMMCAWDIYREAVGPERSKEADSLSEETCIMEGCSSNSIIYTPEKVFPATIRIQNLSD